MNRSIISFFNMLRADFFNEIINLIIITIYKKFKKFINILFIYYNYMHINELKRELGSNRSRARMGQRFFFNASSLI